MPPGRDQPAGRAGSGVRRSPYIDRAGDSCEVSPNVKAGLG